MHEPCIGLVDKKHQEKGEEAAEDVQVIHFEEAYLLRNVVQHMGVNTDADVDRKGKPYEFVCGDILEAGTTPEKENSPEGELDLWR